MLLPWLVYAIAINELLMEAKIAVMRESNIIPFVVSAVFYLIMTGLLTKLLTLVERKFAYYK